MRWPRKAANKAGVGRVPGRWMNSWARSTKHSAGFRICMTTGSDAFTHALLSIKAEIAIAQNSLQQAAVAAGRDSTGEAKLVNSDQCLSPILRAWPAAV